MENDILKELDAEVSKIPSQQNGSESHGSECCIYRVPKSLRNVNWKAYAPLMISIGPLHRENKRLEAMEKEKLKYFKKLTERDGMDEKKRSDILISIKKEEKRLQHFYSEKTKIMENSDEFAKMILLDAVFIIQFFLESYDEKGPKHFDPRMTFDIREDLLLLENQLPLFIIKEIYDRANHGSQGAKAIPFLDLATCHFGKYSFLKKGETNQGSKGETNPGVEGSKHFTDLLRNLMLCKNSPDVEKVNSPDVEKETSSGVEGSKHFTDLLRNLMLCKTSPDVEKETSSGVEGSRHFTLNPPMLKYSAVMLRKAGVRFQVSRDKCLLNITFDRGVLKIPQLEVDRNFERLVRNIMALEQCCYSYEAYICSYMKLMDHLIDSVEDVGLLRRKGIIVNRLGDDAAVSNMINNLCENIGEINYTCFHDISVDKRLNDHFDNHFNHSIANLVLVYFPNIWRGTATVAAAILLILTFIQTISSVKSFY